MKGRYHYPTTPCSPPPYPPTLLTNLTHYYYSLPAAYYPTTLYPDLLPIANDLLPIAPAPCPLLPTPSLTIAHCSYCLLPTPTHSQRTTTHYLTIHYPWQMRFQRRHRRQ